MDWKKTLAQVAPTLASAFGTPMAGVAVKMGLNALGITEGEETDLEAAVLSGSPDTLLKLKTADHDFKKAMRDLDIKELSLDVDDRNSARSMAKVKGLIPQIVISVVYTVAYGVVLYCFMTGKINVPEGQQILFGTLIGILTGAQVQILNFWFGSSSGSKEKTAQMRAA